MIPEICGISISKEFNCDISNAVNIMIDLSQIDVRNILSHVLNYLKELGLVDTTLDYSLVLNSQLNIFKFQSILRGYHVIVQLLCYNLELLSIEEQMLFNELYYFNSLYYNVTSFIDEKFITYFLSQNRALDNRENYTEIKLISKIVEYTEVKRSLNKPSVSQ